MKVLVTVLYEDSSKQGAGGAYPLHDLVMRLVEDEINGDTWRLHNAVKKNPRNWIDNVLKDVKTAALHAGAGQLFLLVDRDKIATHLWGSRRKPPTTRSWLS